MSVRDHIGPVGKHHIGLAPGLTRVFKSLIFRPVNPRALSLALEVYEGMLKTIEQVLAGKASVKDEEQAAQLAAHMILDAAFIHNCIGSAGYPIGKFIYDDLADKLFPRGNEQSA